MSAPFAAEQLGNPSLSGVQTLQITPNLAIKALTTVCPEHREKKTPDVGGLQRVSRRFEMELSLNPERDLLAGRVEVEGDACNLIHRSQRRTTK